MRSMTTSALLVACIGSILMGCAQDGKSLLTTGSTTPDPKLAATPIDAACLALQNRIALLQDEGTIERVEKAAAGQTPTVVIKRAALSKVAELNQANDEFRSRCSKLPPVATLATQPAEATATTVQAVAQQPATQAQ